MGRGMNAPDYKTLIDAEIWAYMDRLDAAYPPDAVTLSVADQRRVYDDMCAVFYEGRPDGVTVTDAPFGGLPCRRYETGQSAVTVVYYHGGGFVVGSLDSHDDVCAEICARTGYRVVSVDYGLAPEVVFPASFDGAWSAFVAITKAFDGDILLCGDSAGGNLAAAMAHHARGRVDGRVRGQVLIYPGLGGDHGQGSYVEHANAPQLTVADMAFYHRVRTGGEEPPKGDPRFAPLQDHDFCGLPPTVLVTAQCDPLSSDGGAYRDALLGAGGKAVWFEEAGLVHACLRARACSARAKRFFDRVVDAVAALGQGQWPYDGT
jgi:acetyl esterase